MSIASPPGVLRPKRRWADLPAALALLENPFITLFRRKKFSGGPGFSTASQGCGDKQGRPDVVPGRDQQKWPPALRPIPR
jgi:hypothetical protein